MKFLLFSLVGGLVMLASVIGLYVESAKTAAGRRTCSASWPRSHFGTDAGRWMFLGFFIAFAIKAPMFPLHTWLPDTAENATPGTSVLLVSVLDKIGTFGMIRFCLRAVPRGLALGDAGRGGRWRSSASCTARSWRSARATSCG